MLQKPQLGKAEQKRPVALSPEVPPRKTSFPRRSSTRPSAMGSSMQHRVAVSCRAFRSVCSSFVKTSAGIAIYIIIFPIPAVASSGSALHLPMRKPGIIRSRKRKTVSNNTLTCTGTAPCKKYLLLLLSSNQALSAMLKTDNLKKKTVQIGHFGCNCSRGVLCFLRRDGYGAANELHHL